jgi:ERI1 exoribonuclease 3
LSKDNFVFVSCGDWDLCSCLRKEAKAKALKVAGYFQRYINLKAYFPKLVQSKSKTRGMMEMLDRLAIKHTGKHHSGKDDVDNLCKICLALLEKHDAKFPSSEVRTTSFD